MTLAHLNAAPAGLRIPRAMVPVVFGFIMSTAICAVTSCLITAINTGFDAGYLERWLRAYGLAWAFAFPTVVLATPHIRRWVERLAD